MLACFSDFANALTFEKSSAAMKRKVALFVPESAEIARSLGAKWNKKRCL
jgi:hypothetical protein